MANPQREHGYTAIANEIMEALAKYRIPGEKRQVLDHILRMSYGFNRKQVELSYGEIAKATGLHRQNVKRAIRWLYSKRITGVIKTDYTKKQVYEFNKNYDEWEPFQKKKTVIRSDYKTVIQSDSKPESLPFIVKTKKQYVNFDSFWSAYPIKKGKKKSLEIWLRLKKKKELPSIEIILKAIANQAAEKINLKNNDKFCPEWKNPTTWLNQGCWEDEINIEAENKPKYVTAESMAKEIYGD